MKINFKQDDVTVARFHTDLLPQAALPLVTDCIGSIIATSGDRPRAAAIVSEFIRVMSDPNCTIDMYKAVRDDYWQPRNDVTYNVVCSSEHAPKCETTFE
jgi:hypothetical protein